MPALPSIVSTYVDGLISALQRGPALDLLSPAQTYAAGKNFIRAQDITAALELLQDSLDTGTMTVTGGTTTTVVDGGGTFVAGQQVGNYVNFVTGALAGTRRRIVANSTTTLTLDSALSIAPSLAVSATAVNGSGANGTVTTTITATGTGGNAYTIVLVDPASGTAAASAAVVGTAITVTMGVTGGVIDPTKNTATLIAAAIDGLAGITAVASGSGVTALPAEAVKSFTGGTVVTTYTIEGGMISDAISEMRDGLSIGAAPPSNVFPRVFTVLDAMALMIRRLGVAIANPAICTLVTAAGSSTTELVINVAARGAKMRIDEFKNKQITVSGAIRRIVGNSESTVLLDKALSVAPAAAVSCAVVRNIVSTRGVDNLKPFPGGQAGDNLQFANLLSQLKAAVVAYTLPT